MEDLLVEYAEAIYGTRTEQRGDAWMRVAVLVLQFDYEPELTKIYQLVSTDTNTTDVIDQIEDIILRCAESLGRRLGITFDTDACFKYPTVLASVLEALTGGLEEFEDYQTLLGIANSEEPIQFILQEMIRYIDGDPNFEIGDVIINVTPNLLTVLTSHFEGKALEEDYETTLNPQLKLLINYAKRFPINPEIATFINATEETTVELIAEELTLPEEHYLEYLTVYATGLAIIGNDSYDEAYAVLEERMGWLNGLDEDLDLPLRQAAQALEDIYREETTDGQD